MATSAAVPLPQIHDNEDGWGPSPTYVPEKFKEIPYAPFTKGDKLGRAADWTGQQQYQGRGPRHQQQQQVNTVFNYYHVDDDQSFTMVDNRPTTKPRNFYSRGRFGQGRGRFGGNQGPRRQQDGKGQQQQQGGQRRFTSGRGGRGGRGQPSGWGMLNRNESLKNKREASVDVRPDWEHVEDVDINYLQRLQAAEPEAEDVVTAGELEFYDADFDRVSTKSERALERVDRSRPCVTTSDDPIIKELAASGEGNVFATNQILAMLMSAPRSVFSWDISVSKVNDVLYFDKREYTSVVFSEMTVNETCHDQHQAEQNLHPINSPEALTKEAVFINQNFSQQVLIRGEKRLKFERPNPFGDAGENITAVGYKYRKFVLGVDEIVVRCEIDAALKTAGQNPELLTIKALNEWDPKASSGVDWRQKLDSQRGAVLATELKNNSCKLAKWTAQALLAGVNAIKLGYVSRHSPKDSLNHVILGTQFYKPREFATQIGLNINNGWGIVSHIVATLRALPDGQYVLLKDPNKSILRIYDVPREGEVRQVKQQEKKGKDEDEDEEDV